MSTLMIGNRKTSSHRDETLDAWFPLASAFLSKFPLEKEPFTVAAFGEWAVKNQHLNAVDGPDSLEWDAHVRRREILKRKINLGGRSDLLSDDKQFQIVVITRHVTTNLAAWQTVRLAEAIEMRTERIARDVCSFINYRRIDVERMANAVGVENMDQNQRILVMNLLQMLDDKEDDEERFERRFGTKVSQLKAALGAPAGGGVIGRLRQASLDDVKAALPAPQQEELAKLVERLDALVAGTASNGKGSKKK